MNCLLIFSILDGGPRKVNDLLTSPSNQFRDYSIWNRIEKLVPQHWNFAPQTSKTFQKKQSVFKLDFLMKSGFPKTRDLSPAAPPRGFIFPEMTRQQIFSGNIGQPSKNVIY
jgi:hypothetical protein